MMTRPAQPGYLPRLVDDVLPQVMATLPAISLVGPRATGKTTSATRLAASVVHLDREGEAAAFLVDPDAALARTTRPVLLDEWQEVPQLFGAVKRAVDADPSPGQFLLTGSVKVGLKHTWPATGRIVKQPVFGLTQREVVGSSTALFSDRVRDDVMALAETSDSPLTVFDYLDLASTSGFPDIIVNRHDADTRTRWLTAYLDDLLTNDTKLVGAAPDPAKFASFTTALALVSSRIVDQATLRDAAGIAKNTAAAYEDLLETVFFSERVPAWRSDGLDRLAAMAKRYLLDAGLLMHILGVSPGEAAQDPALLGATLDTFVAGQIRPELAVKARPPAMLHLRDRGGRHEIDLLLEYPRQRVVGVEVKATAAPGLDDARHLIWLRDKLGDRFLGGVVLHTGPSSFALSSKIVATPISSLWRA